MPTASIIDLSSYKVQTETVPRVTSKKIFGFNADSLTFSHTSRGSVPK